MLSIKNFVWKNPNGQSQKKSKRILDIVILCLFALTFFSVPTFSFSGSGKYVTWALTIVLVAVMSFSMLFFYQIKIDFVSLSLLLFIISAVISSALCGFAAFNATPLLLSFLTFIIYTYSRSVSDDIHLKSFFQFALIGAIGFLAFFAIYYRKELLSFSFSRLGEHFGDINDVSLFLAFGFVTSLYFSLQFNKKHIVTTAISFILTLAFLYCGLSTGSKIFILIVALCLFFFPFAMCGKKKWWLALIIIFASVGLLFAIINLPFLKEIRDRLYYFIGTIFNTGSNARKDYSTMDRFTMLFCGLEMWLRKPLFGWGIWGFATFSNGYGGWSHNNFSESLCNFGLVGTLLFHFGFIQSFICFVKNKNKKESFLPFLLLLFYIIAMISVALNSQKLYALIIGVVFASLCNDAPCFPFSVNKKIMPFAKNSENNDDIAKKETNTLTNAE